MDGRFVSLGAAGSFANGLTASWLVRTSWVMTNLGHGFLSVDNGTTAPNAIRHCPAIPFAAIARSNEAVGSIAMTFYSKHVLPHIIDLAMRNKDATRLRAAWVPQARGEVLEVGIGSGLNLPFYSEGVRRIYGVEPSPELQQMARNRTNGLSVNVELLPQSAEEPLPLSDQSMDTVVTTWTLCSIRDPIRALHQVRRVLKSGGRLIFLEHGRAPDSRVAAWQDRLSPVWKRIAGGCQLNRKIDDLLLQAGFQIDELKTSYLPGPRPMTYTYQGFAHTR